MLSSLGTIKRERGYALPEVLISAAIAAGVFAAIASGLGGAVRVSDASSNRAQRIADLNVIAVRLSSGMETLEALEGYAEWRVERTHFLKDKASGKQAYFEIAHISHSVDDHARLEILVRKRSTDR